MPSNSPLPNTGSENANHTQLKLKVLSARALQAAACARMTPSVPCRKTPRQRAFPKPSEKVPRGAPAGRRR